MVCLLLAAGCSKSKRTVSSYLSWWSFVGSFKFFALYSSDKKPQNSFSGGGEWTVCWADRSVEPHEDFRWWNGMLCLVDENRSENWTIPRSMMSLVRDHLSWSEELLSSAALSYQWRVAGDGWEEGGWRVAGSGVTGEQKQTAPQSSKSRFNISSYIKGRTWIDYMDPSKMISISRCKEHFKIYIDWSKLIPVSINKCIAKRIDQTLNIYRMVMQGTPSKRNRKPVDNWQITGNPSSIFPCSGCRGCAPPPPEPDEAFFFAFAFKLCWLHPSDTPFLSGAPSWICPCVGYAIVEFTDILRKRLYSKL